jgi:hypothetical protein
MKTVWCPRCWRLWLMELGCVWFDDEVCPECEECDLP